MSSRIKLIKSATLATVAIAVTGSWSVSAKSCSRIIGANKKVNLACIGIGHRAEKFSMH